MTPQRISQLTACYRQGLLDDVLPFWMRHAPDREQGGYMTMLDQDGSLLDSDKAMWFQGRFAWLLGELYNTVERRPEWLDLCWLGIEFMERFGFDPADGRMWFHVARDGTPIRKRRYAFTEVFACIAYGEYALATCSQAMADKARAIFERFLRHHWDPGEVPAKFTAHRPMQGLAVPMITIVTAQELRGSIGLPDADRWIDRAIERIRRDFVKPDLQVVMETVGPRGEVIDHFDGRTLNPGHAIEGAWFIMHEGAHRGDNQLIRLGAQMLDWMWARGWDQEYGGVFYFRDLKGLPVQEYWHDMKFWWPHNETIIATLLAHHLTGDDKYSHWHTQVHDWSHRHFPDRQHGEWFGYLHRDGRLSVRLKGNLWKGPFHLPRMQYYCWKLLERMVHTNPRSG